MTPVESDWKLYSKLIPFWRDRYLTVKNREFTATLCQDGKTPTEVFWETKERVDKEAKILDQCLGRNSRSSMYMSMLLMHRYGLITDSDLNQFSEELSLALRKALGTSGVSVSSDRT